MKERFALDREQNILFINFADFKIESRAQVDEMAEYVREAAQRNGGRVYSVVNYENTEIAPDIITYYGQRIKDLQDRFAISTVRYSSSGLTRSMLRYLGAAVDLESNIFTTREEAIGAIRELETRRPVRPKSSHRFLSRLHDARHSLLINFAPAWLIGFASIVIAYLWASRAVDAENLPALNAFAFVVVCSIAVAISVTFALLFFTIIKPLQKMERLTRSLVVGGSYEQIEIRSPDEIGQLAVGLNDAALQLRRDIERLSGLYHISLMMGTGTEVKRICELLTGKIARLLNAEMCVILLCDERDKTIYAQLPAYGVSDNHVRSLRASLDERSIGTTVYATGEPYLTNDVETDALISQSAARMIGAHAILAVPLQVGERSLGVLEVMNKPGGFIEDDKRLVTIFAAQAAHLLANAQLFERLRDSEERHRQIFESALDGLYRASRDGRFVTLNPALCMMLGYDDARELTNENLVEKIFVDAQLGQRIFDEIESCGRVVDVECELRGKSGAGLPARISVRVVTDNASGEVYHLGIVRNVTEQKRLAEQLKISEQLAVVGELVAGVAHEVRNPLCGITTTLSALARRLDDKEAARPFLDVVMKEAAHLNHLMEQLLEHSRPNNIENHPTSFYDLITDLVHERQAQFERQEIKLAVVCSNALPLACFDYRKLHGALANLVDNAIQHTAPGGCIAVDVSYEQRCFNIEISDTGSGIAATDLPKIFEPFFTTRRTGTGLGLAIARKAIHEHGGRICAYSEQNKGTRFVINLPLDAHIAAV